MSNQVGYQVDPNDYFDENYFNEELINILSKYWIFLCPSSILIKDGDYFVFSGFNNEIVIRRNESGDVIAFNNVCKHRGHKLFLDYFGNSEIRCKYHGWLYGDDLNLKKIPWNSTCYHLEESGIKLDSGGYSIKESDGGIWGFFGEKVHEAEYPAESVSVPLQKFSEMGSSSRGVTVNTRKFNWKLIFENLYDRVHPTFLHTKSLNQFVDLSFEPHPDDFGVDYVEEYAKANFANTGFAKGVDSTEINLNALDVIPRGAYLNGHVYPFLHFVTPDGGSTFGYESYIPINCNETMVYTFWIGGSRESIQARQIYVLENMKVASKILKEDWDVVESITSAIKKPDSYIYGAHEKNYFGLKKLGQKK